MSRPKHSKADWFSRTGLLRGVRSFTEFEGRLATLETKKLRGDAFEVFAEAYLATQPHVQAQEVWPFDAIPLDLRERLAISVDRDLGVDGVLRDNIGRFGAYQAKFRVGRGSLSWRKLSTFFGLSDRVGRKVLITNAETLPAILQDRVGFFCIRGSDLDRLEDRDFRLIQSWLEGGVAVRQRRVPRPHQKKAIAEILSELQGADRATCVMPCGSGKTLVSLWVAEALDARKILVLVPSLALLSQALHEWSAETSFENVAYLCVCSDPTVDASEDPWLLRQADLDFPVTTKSSVVSDFLNAPFAGTRWVFSTYHSAKVVADGMAPGEVFEFGVFDEAHRTAGREGTRFTFALKDSNLRISKRLFMTATPRHYDVRKRDKEGDAKLIYSMDATEDFGSVAHTLSFGEAIAQHIICDYKVLVSVLTSQAVSEQSLRRGETVVKCDAVGTHLAATQVALSKAVEAHPVSRIFTFHRTVQSAQAFTGPGGEGVGSHLPGFKMFHVNGRLPSSTRTQRIRAFEATDKGLMSNARCLTEGVNVPAVDMVAFLSPRRSKVDIVQAVGRAMRTFPGKVTGYVLVPLFLNIAAGESIEEAVSRADFEEVWEVLGAMKEQDEALAEIIRQMREAKGHFGAFDDSRFREKVEVLGPITSLEVLRDLVSVRCLDQLGESWDQRYGELKAFVERFGHAVVEAEWPENPRLGRWVNTQRQFRKRGLLRQERAALLDQVGFVWDVLEADWNRMYNRLKERVMTSGPVISRDGSKDEAELARWLTKQRSARRRGQLGDERFRQIEALGIPWNPKDEAFERMFAALGEYKRLHGDYNVPFDYPEDPSLGRWLDKQRQRRKSGRMSQERFDRLNKLDRFVWDVLDAAWEEHFAALTTFKEIHGHCNVSPSWKGNPGLSSWLTIQRGFWLTGKLGSDRVRRLEELGVQREPRKALWEKRFSELLEFKAKTGHCNVPITYEENRELAKWVWRQRRYKRLGKMRPDHIARLDQIGFVWDVHEGDWDRMYNRLREHVLRSGPGISRDGSKDEAELARWLTKQRSARRRGQLSDERFRRIEALGIPWNPKDEAFERMFAALGEYKRLHGNCKVPQHWEGEPGLGVWLADQRSLWRTEQLSTDRVRRLEELGVERDPHDALWQRRFSELLEFKAKTGHCNVPIPYKENPGLATWVHQQRRLMTLGKMRLDRKRLLDEVGFSWEIKRGSKRRRK